MNNGEKVKGKIVQVEVREYQPDSSLGVNCYSGEHLNFISIVTDSEEPIEELNEEPISTVAYTTDKVKVRQQPNTDCDVLGMMDAGDEVTVPAPETGENLVWIPTNGGTKYHSNSGCSSMIDPIQVTEETAIANGYKPCGRCY